jgi:hypothetical protein
MASLPANGDPMSTFTNLLPMSNELKAKPRTAGAVIEAIRLA